MVTLQMQSNGLLGHKRRDVIWNSKRKAPRMQGKVDADAGHMKAAAHENWLVGLLFLTT